ncbi:unnamed protein product, partial [Ascophyllum nodosum]
GSPIFLCKCTRVNMYFLVSQAVQFMRKPTSVHMGVVKRILCYLRGTPHLHIIYRRNSNFELIDFCDASYGTDNPNKAMSTSRSMYFLSGKVIPFSTNIQEIAAQSTTEVKLIAMSSCTKHELYL